MHRIALALFALTLLALPARAHDWNDKGIAWQPFEAGMQLAKKQKKPVLLVVFTEWCPHCRNYSNVFHDPKVVEKARKFVMIHVDKDQEPDVSRRFAPDGEYIPRTYFLGPDGAMKDIHAPRDRFLYFYSESDPSAVLTAMDAALAKPK